MARWFVLGILIFVLSGAVFAQETPEPAPLLIDTDFAADDWMAILYLLLNPAVDVRAITLTGTGETHCDPGVQNALNLLALAGRTDIPVACGRDTPIEGFHAFPADWRRNVDAMSGISLPQSDAAPFDGDAVTLLTETLAGLDQPPVLLTLGPLTNIAEWFTTDPDAVSRLDRIVIMGGAVDVPGNVWLGDSSAEWNIYVDPVAADQVFGSGAPIRLVALDATNQAPVTRAFLDALKADQTTPSAEFVVQALDAQSEFIDLGYTYFWDTLTAALAADPALANWQERTVSVHTAFDASSGRTEADPDGAQIQLATLPEASIVEQHLRNVWNGRDAEAPLPGS